MSEIGQGSSLEASASARSLHCSNSSCASRPGSRCKRNDISASAAVIVRAEVKNCGLKRGNVFLYPGWAGPPEFVNALIRIGQRNDCASLSEQLNDGPLVGVGVLKFVKDDQRVGVRDYSS